ncbi:TonB-dependent receptor plug domain-containing protein, partial [candidate division KSB1 bacterium]|nr:TonB-dependent receptor plug domain-containing protein [candidate division KSB1 bacterium]
MKSKSLKFTLVCAFIISISWHSPAQAGNMSDAQQDTIRNVSSKEYELSTVTVTATRAERSIYLVPRAINYINLSSPRSANRDLSLDESLRQIPGVFVNNRNNLSQGDRIMIRGIGSRDNCCVRGITVLLDGIP